MKKGIFEPKKGILTMQKGIFGHFWAWNPEKKGIWHEIPWKMHMKSWKKGFQTSKNNEILWKKEFLSPKKGFWPWKRAFLGIFGHEIWKKIGIWHEIPWKNAISDMKNNENPLEKGIFEPKKGILTSKKGIFGHFWTWNPEKIGIWHEIPWKNAISDMKNNKNPLEKGIFQDENASSGAFWGHLFIFFFQKNKIALAILFF
jgi:hypothetical protein